MYELWMAFKPIFDTSLRTSGAPNESIVQNHLDIALLNVF